MTKEEALKILKDCRRRGFERNTYFVGEYHTARDMAIRALEEQETVTEFADRCRECGREKVLKKICREIMKLQTYKMYEGEDTFYVELEDVLQIIDKYKALEQEPKTDTWSIKDVDNTFKKHGLIVEQEPCGDCISREATIDGINRYFHDEYYQRTSIQDCRDCLIEDVIKPLPPVNPQTKTGHWIETSVLVRSCSSCGKGYSEYPVGKWNYCPNCGAEMVESEETETWNGIHGQITAPKGTFERIFNDADDDNDI